MVLKSVASSHSQKNEQVVNSMDSACDSKNHQTNENMKAETDDISCEVLQSETVKLCASPTNKMEKFIDNTPTSPLPPARSEFGSPNLSEIKRENSGDYFDPNEVVHIDTVTYNPLFLFWQVKF